jgi:2-methylcitrate dehydratase PrpD
MPLPLFGTVVECDLPCQPETVSGDRPDALNAAFLNAVSANVLEYDDTHLGTVIRPTAPVAPAAMKPPNRAGRPAAEAVERRAEAKENANRCPTCRT